MDDADRSAGVTVIVAAGMLLAAALLVCPGPRGLRAAGSAAVNGASSAPVAPSDLISPGPVSPREFRAKGGGALRAASALSGLAGCSQLPAPWGLLLAPLGGVAGWRIARMATDKARQPRPDNRYVALALDLIAGALSTGLPPQAAIAVVGDAAVAAGSPDLISAVTPLTRVGLMLQWGADPAQAWSALDEPGLQRVATAGRRCAHSGARLAGALQAAAGELRAKDHRRCLDRAGRAGVWALLPLGLCFLPAFVCIGVAPVLIGLGGSLLSH